jgi:hypothetical protein
VKIRDRRWLDPRPGTPSKWGVDRNCGFLEDVVVPSIDAGLQVD